MDGRINVDVEANTNIVTADTSTTPRCIQLGYQAWFDSIVLHLTNTLSACSSTDHPRESVHNQ
jgi:hypothetical protein